MFLVFPKKPSADTVTHQGIVTHILWPERRMRVRFESTEWFAETEAETDQIFKPGDLVRIVGRLNATTLLVKTASSTPRASTLSPDSPAAPAFGHTQTVDSIH